MEETKVPTAPHLKHKPIIAVNNYAKIDARHVDDGTDVVGLSIGLAQYDEKNEKDEISLKVWRHTGERWSRQSEELPIHRCIDLNILLLGALMIDPDKPDSKYSKTILREEIVEENKDKYTVKDILKYYEDNKNFLKPRLMELKRVLDAFLSGEVE